MRGEGEGVGVGEGEGVGVGVGEGEGEGEGPTWLGSSGMEEAVDGTDGRGGSAANGLKVERRELLKGGALGRLLM